ncbi:MAG: rRNA adenine N(6)-methyltransferase family protein [Acidimicrobiales bacterium]
MRAGRRSVRDVRRRSLGQNFLLQRRAEQFVEDSAVETGDLVVEIGAGQGAVTSALVQAGARVIAVEVDPVWARHLRRLAQGAFQVVEADFLAVRLPCSEPFRVVGSIPYGITTKVLHHLFDDPATPLWRADLIVQYEVARKRSACPPDTLVSVAWAPWWEHRLGPRIPANQFRPVPRVDSGVLVVTRRDPPVLPASMARGYARFVRDNWPFPT